MKLKVLLENYGDQDCGISAFQQQIDIVTDWEGWDDDLKEQLQVELCDFFLEFFDNGAKGECHCMELKEQ